MDAPIVHNRIVTTVMPPYRRRVNNNGTMRTLRRVITAMLHSTLAALVVVLPHADACSSRPSAKPRPERPDWNPESHLPRVECTADYAELFCYNGQCYMQMNINGYNEPYCNCSTGFRGNRCQYLGLDNISLPSTESDQLHTAAISAAVCVCLLLGAFLLVAMYVYRQRAKFMRDHGDYPDSLAYSPTPMRAGVDELTAKMYMQRDVSPPLPSPYSGSVVPPSPSGLRPFAPRTTQQMDAIHAARVHGVENYGYYGAHELAVGGSTSSRTRLAGRSYVDSPPSFTANAPANRSRSTGDMMQSHTHDTITFANPMRRMDTQLDQLDIYYDAADMTGGNWHKFKQ